MEMTEALKAKRAGRHPERLPVEVGSKYAMSQAVFPLSCARARARSKI